MSLLKLIIPLFIVLGLLQIAVLTLPFVYWRFSAFMDPISRFIFASALLFIAFVIHPLVIIALITFTIAPTLLSFRHNITARLSTIYAALMPASMPRIPALEGNLPTTNKEWFMTLLSGYAGWKMLGTLPSLMLLLVGAALLLGREDADENRGWLANNGLRGEKSAKVGDKGVSVRSERTDVQVVE